MNRVHAETGLKIGAFFFLLFTFWLAVSISLTLPGPNAFALKEAAVFFRAPLGQWVACFFLGIYLTVLALIHRLMVQSFIRLICPFFLFCLALLCGSVISLLNHSLCTQSLTLLACALAGRTIALWSEPLISSSYSFNFRFTLFCVSLVAFSLVLSLFWHNNYFFKYGSYTRESASWTRTNIFGLLAGVGLVLFVGLIIQCLTPHSPTEERERGVKLKIMQLFIAVLCLYLVKLLCQGLINSYSRGAWIGTVAAIAYLFYHTRLSGIPVSRVSPIRLKLSLSCILIFVTALCYWHFRDATWPPAHRVFSIVNQNDFSWRNRVAAWKGVLQIMSEHPWLGIGGGQPMLLYDRYYLSPKLEESGAGETNGYFIIGATLGIPVLFCFGVYIWRSLSENEKPTGQAFLAARLGSLKATCRSGAIVLIFGFWFDGGLFDFVTAFIFWMLLELGRQYSSRIPPSTPGFNA